MVLPKNFYYSLKDAANIIGCSAETLLQYAHSGLITICIKIKKNEPKLELIEDKEFGTNNEFKTIVGISVNNFDRAFYHTGVGKVEIYLRPMDEEWIIRNHYQADFSKGSVRIHRAAFIVGYWVPERGFFYDLDSMDSEVYGQFLLKPYDVDESKAEKITATIKSVIRASNLSVPLQEIERLKKFLSQESHLNAGGSSLKKITKKIDQQKSFLSNELKKIDFELDTYFSLKSNEQAVIKAGIRNTALEVRDLFTKESFNHAWKSLLKELKG